MPFYTLYSLYALVVIIIGILGACAYYFYAPFYFPKPTGKYAVGMRQFHWIDTARQETRTHDPAHPHRELMVKAWYPAEIPDGSVPLAPYAPALMDFDRQANTNLTVLLAGLHRPIYAYYSQDASVAHSDEPFPIIIFSHGFGTLDDHYTAYCTELASHGYTVLSINHTYDCTFVDFPDGRRVLESSDLENMLLWDRDVWMHNNIENWVADARFILAMIEREVLTSTSPFYGKLDLAHVGMFGHSFGGSTAVQCCRRDARFTAGCSLDGQLLGADFAKPFAKPFMFMRQKLAMTHFVDGLIHDKILQPEERERVLQTLEERHTPGIDNLCSKIGYNAYIIDLENIEHDTFSDSAILKYIALYPRKFNYFGAGSGDGFAITKTINSYLVAFFDKYLKNQSSTILDAYRK